MSVVAPASKPRFPRAAAIAVARELVAALKHACLDDHLIVAGSLRRRKDQVGDVEIVYCPVTTVQAVAYDLISTRAETVNHADNAIAELIRRGVLAPRENKAGGTAMGEKNKLTVHVASGIPVDLFATAPESWWNYVVCRTGGMETNVTIASAALKRGWRWSPYSPGFKRGLGCHPVRSEREVFEFVGLEYREPWERK